MLLLIPQAEVSGVLAARHTDGRAPPPKKKEKKKSVLLHPVILPCLQRLLQAARQL